MPLFFRWGNWVNQKVVFQGQAVSVQSCCVNPTLHTLHKQKEKRDSFLLYQMSFRAGLDKLGSQVKCPAAHFCMVCKLEMNVFCIFPLLGKNYVMWKFCDVKIIWSLISMSTNNSRVKQVQQRLHGALQSLRHLPHLALYRKCLLSPDLGYGKLGSLLRCHCKWQSSTIQSKICVSS